LCVIC